EVGQVVLFCHETIFGWGAAKHVDAFILQKCQINLRIEFSVVDERGCTRAERSQERTPHPLLPTWRRRRPYFVAIADIKPVFRDRADVRITPRMSVDDPFRIAGRSRSIW